MPSRIIQSAAFLVVVAASVMYWVTAHARLIYLVRNSLFLAVAVAALAVPLGTFLAIVLSRTAFPGRSLAWGIVGGLLFLPLYIHYAGWDAGLGARGWITAELGRPLAQPVLAGWRGAIFIHAAAAVAWVTAIVSLGLRTVDPNLEQEALQDSSPLVILLRVTLPRCWQWLMVATLWVGMIAVGEMQITDMYQVRTYAEEVYLGFNLGDQLDDASYSRAGQIGLLGALLGAALACMWSFSPPRGESALRPPLEFDFGGLRLPLVGSAWLLLAGLALVPLVNLIAQAGVEVTVNEVKIERSWSLLKAGMLLPQTASEYGKEIGWSLLIGGAAATLALVIAAPLAWWSRKSVLATASLIGLAALCLAVPGPLVGSGIIWIFNELPVPGLYQLYNNSILAPTLAMAVAALPLVLLILWRAMASLGHDSVESAALEGASTGQRLVRMGLASQLPALAAAWLVALAFGMGELAGSILTTPPGVHTLAITIFGLAHAGVDDQLAALCLVSELIFLLLAALVYGVLRYGTIQRV